jgi:hypothetical protein
VARNNADSERTYSIWPFLVGFVVLGTVGALGLLLAGGATTPTETIPSFTTTSTSSTTSIVSADSAAAVTVPGGAAAPPGVTAVTVDGGLTTYRFDAGAAMSGTVHAYVGRAQVVPSLDGTSVVITVACTEGDGESLSEIRVTESETTLNVEPVVVAPEFPGTCATGTALQQVALPLRSPIGDRQIVLSTPAAAVPVPTP